ncbi:MAG: LamG-like jellyroll fold domain-containing protein, partial [Bacteroidota bacterium]
TLISNTGAIAANEWYFIAAWYDGNEMRIYKNAAQLTSMAKTGNISTADVPIAIGNQPTGAGDRPFSGWIDDVRIYNVALTQSELDELYNEELTSLPVELGVFTAERTGDQVLLEWRTFSESNNRGFFVERAVGSGERFEVLGFVAGQGTTVAAQQYRFVDSFPERGNNYYRLRQQDWDDSESYSKVIPVYFHTDDVLRIFPNPVHDFLSIQTTQPGAKRWVLYNALGQIVKAGTVDNHREQVLLSELPQGWYQLWLLSTSGQRLQQAALIKTQ